VPQRLSTPAFQLEPLSERHSDGDHDAWMSSIAHILATPGFVGWVWPPVAGMSREENLTSVRRHVAHFAARVGFTYVVQASDTAEVIGCVYLYPTEQPHYDCEVRTWVRSDRAELDAAVHEAVLDWLRRDWPFRSVLSYPRHRR
jgi:hypothetical protein